MNRVHWFVFAEDADTPHAPVYRVLIGESNAELSRARRIQVIADRDGAYFSINSLQVHNFISKMVEASSMKVVSARADVLLTEISRRSRMNSQLLLC